MLKLFFQIAIILSIPDMGGKGTCGSAERLSLAQFLHYSVFRTVECVLEVCTCLKTEQNEAECPTGLLRVLSLSETSHILLVCVTIPVF